MRALINRLLEFSVPLIMGVICAVWMANSHPELYDKIVHTPIHKVFSGDAVHVDSHEAHKSHSHAANHDDHESGDAVHGAVAAIDHHDSHHAGHSIWDHILTLHFAVNDLFMVLFFGVAAKEITEACLPSGPLNPFRKALNPLAATLGGVPWASRSVPAAERHHGRARLGEGMGDPNGHGHCPGLVDCEIRVRRGARCRKLSTVACRSGRRDRMGIIAFAYPDPAQPTQWLNTAWILPGMGLAYAFRRFGVQQWCPTSHSEVHSAGGGCTVLTYIRHLHWYSSCRFCRVRKPTWVCMHTRVPKPIIILPRVFRA